MTFAAPIALAFLGLFIPVILLYLLKQRRRRVQVATLLFWDKILKDEQSVTSFTRLRKRLSLLFQLIFIALLAFALARPLLSGRLSGARRVVLFLDVSASMETREGEQTRFELAREQALEVVRGLSIGDTMMLVTFAAQPDIAHPFTDSKRDLEEAIEALETRHGGTDFAAARKILENLSFDDRETHVYLVSDGAFDKVKLDPDERMRFVWMKIGTAEDNVGITGFHARPLPSSSRDFQIYIEVANETDAKQVVPVELRIGGGLLDAQEFTIPAGETVTRTMTRFSRRGGAVEAYVDFEDAFPLDNRAFASLPAPAPISVRLVMENNLFLERALITDEQVDLQVVSPANYQPETDADVTIFANWAPAVTPAGSALFLGAWPADLGLRVDGVIERPVISDWEREHAVNRHLALKNVVIDKAARIEQATNFTALVSSFGHPLVLVNETESRRVMVVGFDTLASDFPLRVSFPIMMANAIRYLAGIESGDQWLNPGLGEILGPEQVRGYSCAVGVAAETNRIVAVIGPDGERSLLDDAASLVNVDCIGFYRGETAGLATNILFAANLSNRAESRIAPSDTLPLTSDTPIQEIKDGFRLGMEPWFFLIVLAIILSAAEWLLFHRRIIE